jgi:hypothetical protein
MDDKNEVAPFLVKSFFNRLKGCPKEAKSTVKTTFVPFLPYTFCVTFHALVTPGSPGGNARIDWGRSMEDEDH